PLCWVLPGCPVPRDLHSFPTRRSSDLAQVGPFLAEALAPDLHVGHAGAPDRTLFLQTAEIGAGEEIAAFKEVHLRPAFRQQGVQDRKSTRLNSSHVSISYAVFCVKKKT